MCTRLQSNYSDATDIVLTISATLAYFGGFFGK